MLTDIKTDEALLRRLSDSAKTKISKGRLRKQRISFIYGGLPSDSQITRAQIESVLAKHEGEEA